MGNAKHEDYHAGIPKITYRGWPGHYIMGHRCLFRLNTLIELFDWKIVVSTVGNKLDSEGATDEKGSKIGLDHYFETMAFWAHKVEHSYGDKISYWEADVTKRVELSFPTYLYDMNHDYKAQENHEKAVDEIRHLLIQQKLEYPKEMPEDV